METLDSAFPEFQPAVLLAKQRTDRLLAPACGLLALAFYWLLTPHCLPPGAPAELTATAMGLPAQHPPFHLLWRALAALASAIPAGTMTVKLALLSAVCSAIAAGMVYQVSVELMMYRLIPNGTDTDRLKVRAVQIGGVVAALAFASASPVALAATRASLRSLDVVLVMGAFWFFLCYYDGGSVLNLLPAGVVCGLGMGENPGVCVAFVVLLVGGIILLWRQDRSSLPMLAFAGLALALMLLFYPGISYLWHLPGGGVTGLLSAHYDEFLQDYTATRTGMFLGVLALLPMVLALATMNQTLNYGEDYESLLTLSALAAASLLVLTNAFVSFRTYTLLNPEPPVLPYLFAAITAGFVTAGWWTVALKPATPDEEVDAADPHADTPRVVKGFGYGVAIALSAGMLFSGFLTVNALRGRPDWYMQFCAETILQDLGTRHWLFGHTPVNTHLAVLAHDRRLPLQVVPLATDTAWPSIQQGLQQVLPRDPAFKDLDQQQLSEALTLGPDVFLRTWLLIDPQTPGKLGVAGPPLFWASCSYTPIPTMFFFTGSVLPCTLPRDFADRALQAEQARRRAETSPVVDGTMVGVLASADLALSASAAHAGATFRRAGATPAAAAMATFSWDEAKGLAARQGRFFTTPLPWVWETTVRTGRLERADILHTIREADLLAAQELKDNGAPARRSVPASGRLSHAADDFAELYAQARDDADTARVDETFSWLAQLDQNGAPSYLLLVLRAEANLAITSGVEQACALLQEATTRHPRDLWAWHLLVAAQLQRGDLTRAEHDLLPAMEKIAGDATNDLVRLTRALILCARGGASLRTARDLFSDVAEANPDIPVAREWALRLDVLLSDDALAARDAGILVACDEDHAQANYVLAMIAMRTRQIAEADRRFRQSLTGTMTPQAMIGRARLYLQRRMPAEALQLARKSTTEYPWYAEGWLVLGDALEATGKPGEAAVVRSRASAQ